MPFPMLKLTWIDHFWSSTSGQIWEIIEVDQINKQMKRQSISVVLLYR
uniref:Uncharacterized protein n=1 Tax=Tetranychus urticae TaxID=32264 RepID=T1K701_TETUR